MSEWKRCTLADLGEIVGGATPSTKNESYYGGDIAWITPKDLSTFQGRFISRGERNITSVGLKNSSARIIPPHSVLFTSRAPIGYVAIAENEVCTNQGFKSIVPNNGTDFLFLYYLLVHNRDRIENMGSGTTFKEVSGSVMKQIEVDVPIDKSEQRAIAETLGALDDKIENNTKINHHLEHMAQAIFKSWFVDFEPFGGVIPDDWQEVPLGSLVQSIDNRGKTPPLSAQPTNYPIIDVKALSGGQRVIDFNNCTKFVEAETYQSWFRSGHPQPYDIVISTVGSLAEMKLFFGTRGCIAQNVVGFRSKIPLYLYQYLQYIKEALVSYNIGSVQPSIKVTHIIKHPILVPNDEVIQHFNKVVQPMTNEIYTNYCQSEHLAAIRDSLLPRLMSGVLSISDFKPLNDD